MIAIRGGGWICVEAKVKGHVTCVAKIGPRSSALASTLCDQVAIHDLISPRLSSFDNVLVSLPSPR